MKYIAIDSETFGLEPMTDSLFQLGYVLDDLENQKPLEELVKKSIFIDLKRIIADPETIKFHQKTGLWERWLYGSKMSVDSALELLKKDISENFGLKSKVNLAGKNLGMFDYRFFRRLKGFEENFGEIFHRRIIDPSEWFFDLSSDRTKPNLEECKRRAGIADAAVTHDALDDALDIVKLVRYEYGRQAKRKGE